MWVMAKYPRLERFGADTPVTVKMSFTHGTMRRCDSDNKTFALAERVSNLETKVASIETAAPLRDKILSDSIINLQATLSRIAVPMVPNAALAPGYGPAMVGPLPPPGIVLQPIVQGSTTTTPTSSAGN